MCSVQLVEQAAQQAADSKGKGNEAFKVRPPRMSQPLTFWCSQAKDYRAAVDEYTNGITDKCSSTLLFSAAHRLLLAQLFCNRSAAHLKLGQVLARNS